MDGASTRKSLDSRLRGNDVSPEIQASAWLGTDGRHSRAGGNPAAEGAQT